MSDESDFLRDILVKPDDATHRLAYANWLEEHGDPRAQFLRMEPDLERISYVAWLEKGGHIDYYLQNFPEVKREAAERKATEHLRNQRRALASTLDPDWVAFMDTLACPFQPFLFFDNHGNPRECQPGELPFAERIGTRGSVVTFESDFGDETVVDQGLMRDLRFVCELETDPCYYGAATCPIHPFICELKSNRGPLTGAIVITALRAHNFESEHIQTLEVTGIPFPGYHPHTRNDEIHNDFVEQYIFRSPRSEDEEDEDDKNELVNEDSGTHGKLKRFVADGKLWYVLLHTTPEQVEAFRFSRYVILFAVGQSTAGDRLVGVVTHQVCHNLCD